MKGYEILKSYEGSLSEGNRHLIRAVAINRWGMSIEEKQLRWEEKWNICINKITELCFVLAVKNYYFVVPQMLTKMTYMGKRKGGFGFRYAERWTVYLRTSEIMTIRWEVKPGETK